MEKRESPPKFDLHQSTAEDIQINSTEGLTSTVAAAGVEYRDAVNNESFAFGSPRDTAVEPGNGAAAQSHGLNPLLSSTLPPYSLPFQGYALLVVNQYPPMYPGYYIPNPSFNGNMGYIPLAGWQPPTAPVAPPMTDRFEGVEPTTQLLVTAQSCLSQAQSQYDLLDRQLKSMDRHRAMGNHDPSLAAQRMAVVQQRAELKAMINRLSIQVDMLQNYKPVSLGSPSGFVPSARPFVPRSNAEQSPHSSRPQSAVDSVELTADTDRGFIERSPAPAPRSRKIIPIRAPPSTFAASNQPTVKVLAASELEAGWQIDQWGVRYRNTSNTSSSTAQPYVQSTKAQVTVKSLISHSSATRRFSAASATPPEMIKWQGERPGSLPKELASLTELYFDALRLPMGVITVFSLPNGDALEVCGAYLQAEPGAMSAREQGYWNKKPIFTKAMLATLRGKARIVDDGQYNDDYLLSKHQSVNMGAEDVQALFQEAMNVEARRKHAQATSAPTGVPLKNVQEDEAQVMEDLSNKGYTSVSLQNVHATVRLPPTYDGATDNTRRDAKTVLTANNKNGSPRAVRRAMAGRGA